MSSKRKIRIFSVDDHPLLREGIAAIINSQDDMVIVAQASTGHEAIDCSASIDRTSRSWTFECPTSAASMR